MNIMSLSETLKTVIKLPVDINGNPNYEIMESYINSTICRERAVNEISNDLVYGWKKFKVGDLFELVNSKPYHIQNVIEDENGIPYITRSKFNNGLKCRVERKEKLELNPSNTISFGAENANFFYQSEEYITGNKMYYISTINLSKYAILFIKTVLESTFSNNFSYSNGMIPERIKDEYITLPVDIHGNPNFNFMESYMKNIEFKQKEKLKYLL